MFWGLIMEPNKRYSQIVEKPFHLSMASLDASTACGGLVQVMICYDERNYLLCTLQKEKIWQVPLDLNFEQGTKISFTCNGDGYVHLTGFVIPEDDGLGGLGEDDDDEEEEDEVAPMLVDGKKRKALENAKDKSNSKRAKKEQAAEDEDEEDDDDSDSELGMLDSDDSDADDLSVEEDDDMEDSEDDDDDDEDEDEDEEEEEDDDDEEEEVQKKVEQVKLSKKEKQKQNKQNQPQQNQSQQNQSQNKDKKDKNKMVNGKQEKQEKEQPKQKKGKQNDSKNDSKSDDSKVEQQQQPKKRTIEGGVQVEDIKVGNGAPAKSGKFVSVYYVGRLKNGKKFDSTQQGEGFKFRLGKGEVIKGWDVGIVGMKIGGKRRISIPPNMAYGAKGSPPVIPPNSWLNFEVELKAIH